MGGIETEVVDDIIEQTWEKAFVNIGINAIGALTRLPNGELLENYYLKRFMALAVDEALEVAKMKDISLHKKDFIDLIQCFFRKENYFNYYLNSYSRAFFRENKKHR